MFKTKTNSASNNLNALILKITCFFWLLAKLIGWRMFTADRLFPKAPVFEWLNGVPSIVDAFLFWISLIIIIYVFLFGVSRILLIGLLTADVFSCMLDQSRLQPWEYQYLFIVFVFIINIEKPKFIPVALTFILAFIYVYSGAGKLNQNFLHATWTNAILSQFFGVSTQVASNHWIYHAGYLLGTTELLAGIGLLFSKTRRTSAVTLILMHLFILLLLGPLGLRVNVSIWPWNVGMILYLYLVFLKMGYQPVFPVIFSGWNKLVVLCWGILPALNFIGYWDYYLSSSLYSGKPPNMIVCINDTSKCRKLIGYFHKNADIKICDGEASINIEEWAMAETKVPVYPEMRVYKILQRKLQRQYPLAGLSFIYYPGKKSVK